MSKFIKKCREEAVLTQAQLAEKMCVSVVAVQNWESGKTKINQKRYNDLAEIFNIPVEKLIKEMLIEEDEQHSDNWPDFLFDDKNNAIVDTLHLNLIQQDLFGLLYIYGSDYLNNAEVGVDTFEEDLKKVPYGFIEKTGSIKFMNQAKDLHRVIKYIRKDFLLKVLRQKPDVEFNVRKLSKNLICEFIDNGYKTVDETVAFEKNYEGEESLDFRINMRKAKIMLPILKRYDAVHMTDGSWSNPIRKDVPEDILSGIINMCEFKEALFKEDYYKDEYNMSYIRYGLEAVTDFINESPDSKYKIWNWKINDTGKKLLEWFSK